MVFVESERMSLEVIWRLFEFGWHKDKQAKLHGKGSVSGTIMYREGIRSSADGGSSPLPKSLMLAGAEGCGGSRFLRRIIWGLGLPWVAKELPLVHFLGVVLPLQPPSRRDWLPKRDRPGFAAPLPNQTIVISIHHKYLSQPRIPQLATTPGTPHL